MSKDAHALSFPEQIQTLDAASSEFLSGEQRLDMITDILADIALRIASEGTTSA